MRGAAAPLPRLDFVCQVADNQAIIVSLVGVKNAEVAALGSAEGVMTANLDGEANIRGVARRVRIHTIPRGGSAPLPTSYFLYCYTGEHGGGTGSVPRAAIVGQQRESKAQARKDKGLAEHVTTFPTSANLYAHQLFLAHRHAELKSGAPKSHWRVTTLPTDAEKKQWAELNKEQEQSGGARKPPGDSKDEKKSDAAKKKPTGVYFRWSHARRPQAKEELQLTHAHVAEQYGRDTATQAQLQLLIREACVHRRNSLAKSKSLSVDDMVLALSRVSPSDPEFVTKEEKRQEAAKKMKEAGVKYVGVSAFYWFLRRDAATGMTKHNQALLDLFGVPLSRPDENVEMKDVAPILPPAVVPIQQDSEEDAQMVQARDLFFGDLQSALDNLVQRVEQVAPAPGVRQQGAAFIEAFRSVFVAAVASRKRKEMESDESRGPKRLKVR